MPSDDTMILGLKISQTLIENKHTKGEVLKYKKYVDYRYLFAMSDLRKNHLSVKFSIFCCLLRGPFPQNIKRSSERLDIRQ